MDWLRCWFDHQGGSLATSSLTTFSWHLMWYAHLPIDLPLQLSSNRWKIQGWRQNRTFDPYTHTIYKPRQECAFPGGGVESHVHLPWIVLLEDENKWKQKKRKRIYAILNEKVLLSRKRRSRFDIAWDLSCFDALFWLSVMTLPNSTYFYALTTKNNHSCDYLHALQHRSVQRWRLRNCHKTFSCWRSQPLC